MRVRESYVTLGPSSAIAHPRRRCVPPRSTAQMGIQRAEGDGIGPQHRLYPPKFSPSQTQSLSQAPRTNHLSVRGSGNWDGEWSACPSKANAEGIRVPWNQSCRAFSRGLQTARSTQARGRGWMEAPSACRRGRWPRGEQVVRRPRSRPQGSNFPASWREKGAVKAREAGRERAVRGSRYRVRRGAAPRLGLCSPPDLPLRAACSGAGHRRVSLRARRLISGASAAPASPWAVRWPLAAGRLQLQLGEARPKRPEAVHPHSPCPGPAPPRPARLSARLSARLPSDASSRGASRRQPARSSPEPPPPPKCTINFPSLPPPRSPPPPRPRLLMLPPSPPASPSPRPPGRALPPTPLQNGPPGSPRPLPPP